MNFEAKHIYLYHNFSNKQHPTHMRLKSLLPLTSITLASCAFTPYQPINPEVYFQTYTSSIPSTSAISQKEKSINKTPLYDYKKLTENEIALLGKTKSEFESKEEYEVNIEKQLPQKNFYIDYLEKSAIYDAEEKAIRLDPRKISVEHYLMQDLAGQSDHNIMVWDHRNALSFVLNENYRHSSYYWSQRIWCYG